MGKQPRSGSKFSSVVDRRENHDLLIFVTRCEKLWRAERLSRAVRESDAKARHAKGRFGQPLPVLKGEGK